MSEKTVAKSSGNVFQDLGLSQPSERLAKAELARGIGVQIKSRGLTQSQAANLLKVDQPKVSNLIRGNLSGFSMERLLRFAMALGYHVDLSLREAETDAGAMRVSLW